MTLPFPVIFIFKMSGQKKVNLKSINIFNIFDFHPFITFQIFSTTNLPQDGSLWTTDKPSQTSFVTDLRFEEKEVKVLSLSIPLTGSGSALK